MRKKENITTEDSNLISHNENLNISEKNEKKMNYVPATWKENHDDNFMNHLIKNLPDQNIEFESRSAKFIRNKKHSLSKNSFLHSKRKKKESKVVIKERVVGVISMNIVYCRVC